MAQFFHWHQIALPAKQLQLLALAQLALPLRNNSPARDILLQSTNVVKKLAGYSVMEFQNLKWRNQFSIAAWRRWRAKELDSVRELMLV